MTIFPSFLSLFSLHPAYFSLFILIIFLFLSLSLSSLYPPSLCLSFSPDFDYFNICTMTPSTHSLIHTPTYTYNHTYTHTHTHTITLTMTLLSDREDRILRQRSIVHEIKDRISLSLRNDSKNQNGDEVQGPVQGLVQGLSSSLLSAQTILKSHEVIYCILYIVYCILYIVYCGGYR